MAVPARFAGPSALKLQKTPPVLGMRGDEMCVKISANAATSLQDLQDAMRAAHPSRLVSAPVSMTIAATREAAVVPALAISVWVWPSLRALGREGLPQSARLQFWPSLRAL